MANQQQHQPNVGGTAKSMSEASGRSTGPTTGTSDELYGLVSVLYHALQGSENYARYRDDAKSAGDAELESFFQECQAEDRGRADRAKDLLLQKLEEELDEDEDAEEEEG